MKTLGMENPIFPLKICLRFLKGQGRDMSPMRNIPGSARLLKISWCKAPFVSFFIERQKKDWSPRSKIARREKIPLKNRGRPFSTWPEGSCRAVQYARDVESGRFSVLRAAGHRTAPFWYAWVGAISGGQGEVVPISLPVWFNSQARAHFWFARHTVTLNEPHARVLFGSSFPRSLKSRNARSTNVSEFVSKFFSLL